MEVKLIEELKTNYIHNKILMDRQDASIEDLDSQISRYVELTQALEAGQVALVRKFSVSNDANNLMIEALEKIHNLDYSEMRKVPVIVAEVLEVVSQTVGGEG